VGWVHRLGRGDSEEGNSREPEEADPSPVRRAAPALAALFEELSPDRSHAVLDLGLGTEAHLGVYSRFARWVRFAGLLPEPPSEPDLRAALGELPANPDRPYDVVLVWNLPDRLGPEHRACLIERLASITSERARLYAVVDSSRDSTVQSLRFTPLGPDRVAQVAVGEPVPAGPPLLPAQMERVLDPFRVLRAFTLRIGMREYLAVKDSARG
jgi:hypothetical protein